MNERASSAYDAIAPTFDTLRELPPGVAEAIRSALWAGAGVPTDARVLDIGAGTGRVGRAFVSAGDHYVGVDSSLGMLKAFAERIEPASARPSACLAQAEGERLPFAAGVFDVVMLIQVLSGARGGRRLLAEAQRVARPGGTLIVGRTNKPEDGVEARLKRQLSAILDDAEVAPDDAQGRRSGALSWLESVAVERARVVAASWTLEPTPRRFLDRHRTGHQFLTLPESIREAAMVRLAAWAIDTFGSLDAVFREIYEFELQIFRLPTDVE